MHSPPCLTANPRLTQTQIHKLCQEAADQILNDFKPNLMIAIGGGGYVPARILRYDISCVAPTP
jgi:hypoxanthine phosphoribosyltransferase